MNIILAAAEAPETFNSDYYLAIVTVLPILMVAVEVLTNFNKSINVSIFKKWPIVLQLLIAFFYLFSPIITAVGIVVGVIALMYRHENAVFQWVDFVSLVSILGFLAISMTVYLFAFDTAQTGQEREEAKRKDPSSSDGAAS